MNDERQSSAAGAIMIVLGVLTVIGILGIVACAGLGFFYYRTASLQVQQSQMRAEDAMVMAEMQRTMAEQQLAAQMEVIVTVDRDGTATAAEVLEKLDDGMVRIRWLDRDPDAEDATAIVPESELKFSVETTDPAAMPANHNLTPQEALRESLLPN